VNTVESPGQAADAITACASTNNHFFGIPIMVAATTFAAAVGDFGSFSPAVAAPLANWSNPADSAGPTRACNAVTGTPFAGSIVVLDRGSCTFSTKIRNAQSAGAAGVVVVNNVAGDPTAMGQDGTPNQPTISGVMVGLGERAAIRADAGQNATANGATVLEVLTNNQNFLAGFSSRGPANLLDIKPDVCAPGVNVLSSVPGNRFAMFQGTSMATPHVAGSSALLRQLHPDWTPAMIKSALVDTATRAPNLGTTNPMNIGGGVLNLAAATSVSATLEPATLSFRKIEPGTGKSKTIDMTITNVSGTSHAYNATAAITMSPAAGAAGASVSPASLTLGPGESGTLSVTVGTAQSAPEGQYWGRLTVSDGQSTLAAPLWFAVRTFVDAGPLR